MTRDGARVLRQGQSDELTVRKIPFDAKNRLDLPTTHFMYCIESCPEDTEFRRALSRHVARECFVHIDDDRDSVCLSAFRGKVRSSKLGKGELILPVSAAAQQPFLGSCPCPNDRDTN